MNHRAVLAFCREKEVKAIDLRYADPLGAWRSVTVPVERLNEAAFEQGFLVAAETFPGHGPRDRLLIPHSESVYLDAFAALPTLVIAGSLQDPITRDDDLFEPRAIATRALGFLANTGIADRAQFTSSCEFFVFNKLQHHRALNSMAWSNCQEIPSEIQFELRNAMLNQLREIELPASLHRQLDETGRQAIDMDALNLIAASDALLMLKHVVRRTARHHQKEACFMPIPTGGSAGAGLQVMLSLWRAEEPVFAGQAFGGLSDVAMRALGGILHHTPALVALCNPTTNSYKRLHRPNQRPRLHGYSQTHPESVCRIPMGHHNPKLKGIVYCLPDPTLNPYLAYSAILMAAIDGIQNKLEVGTSDEPLTLGDGSSLAVPRSLWEALEALEDDMDFLLRGDVFTRDFLDQWIDFKRTSERLLVESDPTPAEFHQYRDL